MAKLFTNHDYMHLHAIFGLICLYNFILRLYYIAIYNNSFPFKSYKHIDIILTLSHLALPLLSLNIHVPSKRIYSKPMIWPEFRLHSIIFASRHVFTTILSICEVNHNIMLIILSRLTIVYTTIYLAGIVTKKYGDKESRTTNAMPYPDNISEDNIKKIKYEYAKKQFGATLYSCICNPTYNFLPLYAIQFSPFLMTLVRKGKCNSKYYHIVYTLALAIPTYYYSIFFPNNIAYISLGFFSILSYTLRIKYKVNSYLLWLLIIPLFIYINNNITNELNYYFNYYKYTILLSIIMSDIDKYKPLFLST